jgi:dienelactone hydrolase
MSVASRYLSCSLGVLLLLPAGFARGDGREGVEAYRSGEATVSLEWFAPADRGRFPTVVLLHPSGGMDPGTAAIFRATGRDFAERGYVVLIPRYFERTGHIAGAALKDGELSAFVKAVEDGVDFGIASGIVDEDRIGVLGYSMGAYIAFSRAARDPRIKAVVSCSGSLPVESRATFPPVLILQGSNDRSSPVSRVAKFQEALKAKGTPCASHIYKGMGHGFDLERWEDAMMRAGAFFDRHLRGPKKPKGPAKKARRGDVRKESDRPAEAGKGDAVEDPRKADHRDPFEPGGAEPKEGGDGSARRDPSPGPSGGASESPGARAVFGVIWDAISRLR